MLQVTVISPSATDSDALSNAFFVSGPEERARLLDERQQDCALIVMENQRGYEKQRGQEQGGHEKQFATKYEAIRWPADVANGHLAELENTKES